MAHLRSGEIPRGRSRLGTPDGKRCGLGVLCDMAVEDGIIAPPEALADNGRYSYDDTVLPESVVSWAGMQSNSGVCGRWGGAIRVR